MTVERRKSVKKVVKKKRRMEKLAFFAVNFWFVALFFVK